MAPHVEAVRRLRLLEAINAKLDRIEAKLDRLDAALVIDPPLPPVPSRPALQPQSAQRPGKDR